MPDIAAARVCEPDEAMASAALLAIVVVVSEPVPFTVVTPPLSVTLPTVRALSNENAPALDLTRLVAVTEPPVSEAVPEALLTVNASATTPSGRTVIAAADVIRALSPEPKKVLPEPAVQLFVV